ncbi:zinc finger MYM-type protein 2 isoform 1-T3 [Spinachia spinachia]
MDGESEPNPAATEEAAGDPVDATPSPERLAAAPSEEARETVSMATEVGEEVAEEAEKEVGGEDDDDVVLLGGEEEDPQPSAATPTRDTTPATGLLEPAETADVSTPGSPISFGLASPAPPPVAEAEPIVIDDEEDATEQRSAPASPPPRPGGSFESRSPGALSSPEDESELRIASVTTLGTGDRGTGAAGSTPSQLREVEEDMALVITSVTSLQGAAPEDEGHVEENGLQIASSFSLNPDGPLGRPPASFNPGRGSGPAGQAVQNGEAGEHNRTDSWISQSASVPRSQKQVGVDTPSAASSLPKAPGQSSSQPQPRTVKVTCANCKKPLKKGQTAYQRKGSTHLFCSTTCLSAFSHKPAPKKSCTMCKKDITNMKGTIVAQVDSSESFQEFCSTGCLGAYESKQNPPKSTLKTKCTVCGKLTEIRHEVSFKTVTHKICSDTCFNVYRRANGLIMNCCEQCGDYLPSRASANHFLLVDGQQKRFCCQNCIRDFKQAHSKLATCLTCKTLIKTGEVLHSLGAGGAMGSFCSVSCMNKGKLAPTSFLNTEPSCHFCKRNSLPQYQATLPEGNVLNFCSSPCVTKFQNAALLTATNGETALSTTNSTGSVALKCNYCRGAFSLKPETLEWQDKVHQFCSKTCCEDYKKLHCIVTSCEYCQEEKTLHEMVKFSGVKRPFCSEGCKLLFKQDFIKRLGLKCVSCNHCSQLCKRGVTRQLGGMTRNFCGEACAKKFNDWYFKAARCDCCKVQGSLTESVMWRSEMKHFCDQECLLKFYCQQNEPIMVTQRGPENATLGYEMQTKLGLVSQGTAPYGGPMRDVKNKAVLCKPLTLTKATYCKPHMQSKLLQTDADDGVKREYIPVPIPVPVFIPVPMNMYSQLAPAALSLPVPVPVPVFLPTTLQGAEQIVQSIRELRNEVSSDLLSVAEATAQDRRPDGKKAEHRVEAFSSCSEEEEKLEEVVEEKVEKPEEVKEETPEEVEEVEKEKPVEEEKPEEVGEEEVKEVEKEKPVEEETPEEVKEEKWPEAEEEEEQEVKEKQDESDTQEGEEEEKTEEEEDMYESDLDLEADFPQASDSAPALEGVNEDLCFSLPAVLAEEEEEVKKKKKKSATPPHPERRGSKRRALEEGSGGEASRPKGRRPGGCPLPLKARYGVNAWKRWALSPSNPSEDSDAKDGPRPARARSNLLLLSSEELNAALSRFVREVCRPSGERYSADSIFYLCLGIQQHLRARGRTDDLFGDPSYRRFGEELNTVLTGWRPRVLPDGSLWGRVEERCLWSSGHLGEQSPAALLRSLVYLNAKHLGLRTVEQHLRLSFANVYGPDGVHPVAAETAPCVSADAHVQSESRKRKRTLEDGDQDEDSGGPATKHQCRLYDLYRSKCPPSLRERLDVFYLQPDPERGPDDALWFSSTPLERQILGSLLARVLLVRDVYTDTRRPEEVGEGRVAASDP